ncbi:MAG: calcium-translocating P-type ATPase, PMCA-type [Clostridia bacterium]|nr:calcium-translocating P-type ATPase, PMCA-type [Clostridia bacterium]
MKKIIEGLSSEEVKRSRELHGDNSLRGEKKRGFFKRFFENLSDPIIRILLIALAIQVIFTFGHTNYFEVGGIIAAILLSTTVSTLSEYRSEQAFEKLREDAQDGLVSVLRDGKIVKILSSDLVVGDIVYLSAGEKIQADGEIISGRISVDQSALNGESAECVKSAGKDYGWDLSSSSRAFRGSVITDGSAIMRVGRVGGTTYYGMVAKDVQTETRVSPLKLRLGGLASQISKIGYVVASIVGASYLFNSIFIDHGFDFARIALFLKDVPSVVSCLISALTLMITVVVVAAPEGLPMMITVVLSANMKKMLADNILVKKLVGIETAGSMNILFTDKTGTLTVGRPQCERFITVSGVCKGIKQLREMKRIYECLTISAGYNTDVQMVGGEITGGNATDRAIYEFFATESPPTCKVASRLAFNSERKYSSATLENGITVTKGAAEIIISKCKYALNKNGEQVRFDLESVFSEYMDAVENGERVIGVAINDGSSSDALTLVALIVMKDKVRRGVREAVMEVSRAGIQVVMITGDGRETATAIAKECGIYNKQAGHIVLSSEEMGKMNDDEIKAILPRLRVVSRALPQDKTRLVRLSQELDLVAGMTGDGINDAPSLKLSDVGFAMGSGTDIAKSAADIVILDNSFFAISRTILYGRTIFKSIRKFITFQLTMNLAACGVSLIGQFIGVETPITITQMLWINIIMDTLGGLAFAGEAPMSYYMREKPKRRDEPILSREMLNQIFLTGAYTLSLSIFFLASPTIRQMYGSVNPTESFYTAFYALFIFLGIFNCLLARCSRLWLLSNISKNKPFILIMALITVIQVCMIYFGGALFRCVPLLPHELSFVFLLSMTVLPFEMLRRLFYKLK